MTMPQVELPCAVLSQQMHDVMHDVVSWRCITCTVTSVFMLT